MIVGNSVDSNPRVEVDTEDKEILVNGRTFCDFEEWKSTLKNGIELTVTSTQLYELITESFELGIKESQKRIKQSLGIRLN